MLTKFTESDHEKVERLMELHFKYVDQVALTEDRLRNSTEEMDAVSDLPMKSGIFVTTTILFVTSKPRILFFPIFAVSAVEKENKLKKCLFLSKLRV